MRAPLLAAFLAVPALLAGATASTQAQSQEHRYVVTGRDSFSIGDGDITSETRYRGTETLTVRRNGKAMRYTAKVEYTRDDQGASSDAKADYVTDLLPSGEALDTADHDPDYLTILNQPFAAQLDTATLTELRHIHGPVPFEFPSPFTGATLHGRLDAVGPGRIGGRDAFGVRFLAGGPVRGPLPDRPGLILRGGIVMRGTAYYDTASALLLALDATVPISGSLSNRKAKDAVTIVYRRVVRAQEPQATAQRTR